MSAFDPSRKSHRPICCDATTQLIRAMECLATDLVTVLPVGHLSGPNPQRTSIQLNVGVPDHLSPEGELRLDEVTQLFGRRGKSLEAYILELRLSLRAVDDLAQRAVELGHDLRRRAGRGDEARMDITPRCRD